MIETESINRYFIIEQSEYDFAQISLSLWGFCSWNPESPEFDHVSISVIDQTNTMLIYGMVRFIIKTQVKIAKDIHVIEITFIMMIRVDIHHNIP